MKVVGRGVGTCPLIGADKLVVELGVSKWFDVFLMLQPCRPTTAMPPVVDQRNPPRNALRIHSQFLSVHGYEEA